MSAYPGSDQDRRVPVEPLQRFVHEVFEHCGMSANDAALLADTLVKADLRGVHSHGVLRVPEYAKKLSGGGVDPQGEPRVARDSGAALLVDGKNSMGQIAANFAMRQAVERAKTTQVAVASVGGSNHCGAMGYYATQALPEDMIGLASTNALPTMAPWGGLDKILGMNPLAVAIPAGKERPIVHDAAFAASAHGKIRVYAQKGLPIPVHWAFDAEGHPTTDAAAAVEGLVQPIGEFKGTGLALVMGILTAVLSGAAFGTELGSLKEGAQPGRDGQLFIAIRIAAFGEPETFKQSVDRIIQQFKNSRRAEGVNRIYIPGEIEAETEQEYQQEGIPLNTTTLEGLRTAAERVGSAPLDEN
jgi:LDH2 family malate/lactate/ureidoglycolate dehydrogenase